MPARLPDHTRIFGPVSQRHVLRLTLLYATILGLGFALAELTDSAHLQTFGLGLVLPGGGFLAHYDLTTAAGLWHLVAFAAGAGSFVLALGIWFGPAMCWPRPRFGSLRPSPQPQ
ncbi:hypothetical protein [Asticcacaulis sp. AC460]|uniref:hypothetical protein n=1 Tax=Asticcacaulis sp. AC460 TaxID=1282360 RepID=UPI000411FFE0|nr:hypothetical protein [Asticcacaulis sp. AC460]